MIDDFAPAETPACASKSKGEIAAMSKTEILEELRRMPESERRELVEAIDLEFGNFNDDPTPEQIAEFDRRGDELRRNPAGGIPWEQVRAELTGRINGRSWAAK